MPKYMYKEWFYGKLANVMIFPKGPMTLIFRRSHLSWPLNPNNDDLWQIISDRNSIVRLPVEKNALINILRNEEREKSLNQCNTSLTLRATFDLMLCMERWKKLALCVMEGLAESIVICSASENVTCILYMQCIAGLENIQQQKTLKCCCTSRVQNLLILCSCAYFVILRMSVREICLRMCRILRKNAHKTHTHTDRQIDRQIDRQTAPFL